MIIPSFYEEFLGQDLGVKAKNKLEQEDEDNQTEQDLKNEIKNRVFKPELLPKDLVYFLKKSLKKIEHLKKENAVIMFGNTGCGKSTMILSLIYGP